MSYTLLIIDDDPDILVPMSSFLSKRDFSVIEAKSSEEAFGILETQQPDLIITDVLLPQANGYEFLKQVKADAMTRDIPVLVMTGRGKMRDVFETLGVSGFIAKPFVPEELFQMVKEILSIQEAVVNSNLDGGEKRVLIVGRQEFEDVLKDIRDIVEHLKCQGLYVFSVPDAVAKTVEFVPDAFIIDVQLNGKDSAELVNIIRHLPNYEDKPIIGFCYYDIENLGDSRLRQKIHQIQHDAEKFLENGALLYVERYAREEMIKVIKEHILTYGKSVA